MLMRLRRGILCGGRTSKGRPTCAPDCARLSNGTLRKEKRGGLERRVEHSCAKTHSGHRGDATDGGDNSGPGSGGLK